MDLISTFPLQALGPVELKNVLPLIVLSFGAMGSLIAGTHKTHGHRNAFIASLVTLFATLILQFVSLLNADVLLGGALAYTPFTKCLSLMSIFFALVAVVFTHGVDKREGLLSEVYGLTLFSTAGMILMVSSVHLVFTFIALEIMSLAVYVLVTMRRASSFSAEAGLKYFILGGLASALFLYGSALVFGTVGSFQLAAINNYLATSTPSVVYYIGLGLITVAMLFKVGAFPFHGWVPDVYQGAATNVTGFMGAAVKFTAFMAFVNIAQNMVFAGQGEVLGWFKHLIWICSAASMIYGNFVAISQTEIKRMLSFSTIAHTGYLLMGLLTLGSGSGSTEALILYLFFYALTNLGAFAVISLFEKQHQKDITFDELAGLGLKYPFLGALFTLFLLSMAGIPLTSGFIGKYGLFNSTVVGGEVPLVILAVLTSVVSVYYYLRVIVYLFMKESSDTTKTRIEWKGASFAAAVSAAATLQFGLFPKVMIQFVRMLTR